MSTATTVSGRHVDLLFLDKSTVHLEDVAVHLAHIRRFNGATTIGYSVAAHSLHVSDLVKRMHGTLSAQLAALHHDAHEYLLGDITTPAKDFLNALCGNAFAVAEQKLQRQVLEALQIRCAFMSNRALIHRADMIALATERRDLQPRSREPWPCLSGIEPDFEDIRVRAKLPDDFWAQTYVERDRTLRAQMADRLEWPQRPVAKA